MGNIRDNSGNRFLEDLLVCFPPTAFPHLMPLLVFLEFHEHTLDKLPGFRGHGYAPWVEHPISDSFFHLLFSGIFVYRVQPELLGHKLATPSERGWLAAIKNIQTVPKSRFSLNIAVMLVGCD